MNRPFGPATLLVSVLMVMPLVVPVALGMEGDPSSPASLPSTDGAAPGSAPAPSPLLEALAFAPSDAESVEFLDWAGLKAQHGRADLTSASPLAERQALLLDVIGSEATLGPLGLKELSTWPETWGWDTTDLAWRLDIVRRSGPLTILRFRDGWDPAPFVAQLERHGYERIDDRGFSTYRPGPDAWYDAGGELERLLGEVTGTVAPRLEVTLLADGGPVIIGDRATARLASMALSRDPEAVATSPFGRVAEELGRSLVALIADGTAGCSGTGAEIGRLPEADQDLAGAVGPLHPYDAFGAGYERHDQTGAAIGRYVFAYPRGVLASRDLEGRSTLAREGLSADGRRPIAEAAFTLASARVIGRDLVLDVEPRSHVPSSLFDELSGLPARPAVFAICGETPASVSDVPLFAGPATLTLSGGRGSHAWDEVRLGADQARLTVRAWAEQDGCRARVSLDDAARDGHRLVSTSTRAAPGTATRHTETITLDYATASLLVESTCEGWSLRIEALRDPALPYHIRERSYPVRGSTISALAAQTDHIKGRWAAYTKTRTDWSFWWTDAGASCDVTHGAVQVRASIEYPRWRPRSDADPAIVARWDAFMANLRTHELGHVTIALQGADAIDDLLDEGLSASTCGRLERLANRAASHLYHEFAKLDRVYDQQTDHGISQGTGLP